MKDGSRMYGHGITTLMLSEMLGMGVDAQQDELIRAKVPPGDRADSCARKKVPKNEANRGGWRYSPDTGESDMSVTVWQTMALRAAKNAGLDVPKSAIDDAVTLHQTLLPASPRNERGRRARRLWLPGQGARAFHDGGGSARAAGLRRIRVRGGAQHQRAPFSRRVWASAKSGSFTSPTTTRRR